MKLIDMKAKRFEFHIKKRSYNIINVPSLEANAFKNEKKMIIMLNEETATTRGIK